MGAFSKIPPGRRVEAVSKVYGRGRSQIPNDVRKDLNLKDGDKLLWIKEEGKWTVEKA